MLFPRAWTALNRDGIGKNLTEKHFRPS